MDKGCYYYDFEQSHRWEGSCGLTYLQKRWTKKTQFHSLSELDVDADVIFFLLQVM